MWGTRERCTGEHERAQREGTVRRGPWEKGKHGGRKGDTGKEGYSEGHWGEGQQ